MRKTDLSPVFKAEHGSHVIKRSITIKCFFLWKQEGCLGRLPEAGGIQAETCKEFRISQGVGKEFQVMRGEL